MYMPAEWERQWGIQLIWPHQCTDWNPILQEITATYLLMAGAIVEHERLLVVAQETEPVRQLFHEAGIDISRVVFHECSINDTWARDSGFITLKSSDQRGVASLLDFKFNGWGEKFEASKDNAINQSLYQFIFSKSHQYVSNLDFVLEGGSIESDGMGTVFTTTGCLMASHRNQPLTQQQIEQELKQRLHAHRIMWIDHGHLAGDDTDGHIDTLVRIAPNDTLLYVACDNKEDEHYSDLKLMEQQLLSFRSIQGKPYRLIGLPMPDPIYDDGERLPATYANFLIINDAVLVPTYGQSVNDERAIQLIQQAFPDHAMVPIDSCSIIRQHGSIHCCTMQFFE